MTIDDPVRPAAGVTAMRSPSAAEQRRHVSTSAKLTSPQRGHFGLDMETVVSVVGRRRPRREPGVKLVALVRASSSGGQ